MGYLVAQVGDLVRIEQPGPLYGTFAEVIAERGSPAPSVTARVCTVKSDGGAVVEVHADLLDVCTPHVRTESEAPDGE